MENILLVDDSDKDQVRGGGFLSRLIGRSPKEPIADAKLKDAVAKGKSAAAKTVVTKDYDASHDISSDDSLDESGENSDNSFSS